MEIQIMIEAHTPERVREQIAARPGSDIQWRDDDWRVSYGFGPDAYLDILYLTEYNAAAEWTSYQQRLSAFVRQHREIGRRQDEIMELIGRQKFALTALAESAIVDLQDPRFAAILEFAHEFGSCLVCDKGLFDLELNPIVAGGGTWDRRIIDGVENCAMYFPTHDIPFKEFLPQFTAQRSLFKQPGWVEFGADEGRVRLNITQDDLVSHLSGFRGYIDQLADDDASKQEAIELLARTQFMVGVGLPGTVSPHGCAFGVLSDLLHRYEGFMFVRDSVLLPDRRFVVGPMAAENG